MVKKWKPSAPTTNRNNFRHSKSIGCISQCGKRGAQLTTESNDETQAPRKHFCVVCSPKMIPKQLACDVPHPGPDWRLGRLITCIPTMRANDSEQELAKLTLVDVRKWMEVAFALSKSLWVRTFPPKTRHPTVMLRNTTYITCKSQFITPTQILVRRGLNTKTVGGPTKDCTFVLATCRCKTNQQPQANPLFIM